MKKTFHDSLRVYHSDNMNDILQKIKNKLPYPFELDMLELCKKENKLKQEYYYLENGEDYAFFIVYLNRLNIFTLGRHELYMKVKTIGFPCSLSNCGYVTNNLEMMLDYIETIKGSKLVLNVNKPIKRNKMVLGETLPTCIFAVNALSIEEYMSSLRSTYRRRINIAIEKCADIIVKTISNDSIDVHPLYLNTYEKSQYKLEKLEKGFFDKVDATKLVFCKDEKPIGFVLLKKDKEQLIFMLCGMDYRVPTSHLYHYMLYNIISFAIDHDCRTIDFGQTSEQTKMKFGAMLEKRYFYAGHSNIVINQFVKMIGPLLEYKYSFPQYRVFKECK